ncbi:hypothetical protein LUZ61_004671 [Rhynchospora tenuis]|uniref:RNA polymerase I-specific transcription initiation factor RRN3 n=1 Tax=Rhynchospora tenuis TaxID=198213 RepID=A0AAD5ZN46_9POAL|nr:hypothetical protein LUZ61_004671 [Rhynchospora tenuis]
MDLNDKEQYDFLLSILNPSARFGPNEEAFFVTVLKALTRVVSQIDDTCHATLLSNIFRMRIWLFELETRKALLKLISSLAAVPDKYLEGCLHMLVSNFVPPEPGWVITSKKREIHQELHACLQDIFQDVPLSPIKLCAVIDKTMPCIFDSKSKMSTYVECMLGLLIRKEIGEVLSANLLSMVFNLLVELDVNITWNDTLDQEDQNICIFDRELEYLDHQFSLRFSADDGKVGAHSNNRDISGNNNSAFIERLDGLMVVVCEHLNSCVKSGRLMTTGDYKLFMRIFEIAVLKLHESKFTQFVMFYACSLDPEIWGLQFAFDLADIFMSTSQDPISRMSAISYLASYLSRAKFISSSIVANIVIKIVNWCSDYCNVVQERIFNAIQKRQFNPIAHQIYYSACQAVMYILCFRMRELLYVPIEGAMSKVPFKSFLFDLPLGYILFNALDPLKVCLPSIVQEFLRQAKAAHLFHASVSYINENAIDSELSRSFGGTERLDIFFPFDPYLLNESDRFIRPNFVYWSMVNTTYNNCNSKEVDDNCNSKEVDEEEDEAFEDVDAPRISSDPISSFEDHYNVDYKDSDGEYDNLE